MEELTSCGEENPEGLRVYLRLPDRFLIVWRLCETETSSPVCTGECEAFCHSLLRLRNAFERYFLFKGCRAIEMTGAQVH